MQSTATTQRNSAATDCRNEKDVQQYASEGPIELQEVLDSAGRALKSYATQNPAVVAVVVVFAGFYVGWKGKHW